MSFKRFQTFFSGRRCVFLFVGLVGLILSFREVALQLEVNQAYRRISGEPFTGEGEGKLELSEEALERLRLKLEKEDALQVFLSIALQSRGISDETLRHVFRYAQHTNQFVSDYACRVLYKSGERAYHDVDALLADPNDSTALAGVYILEMFEDRNGRPVPERFWPAIIALTERSESESSRRAVELIRSFDAPAAKRAEALRQLLDSDAPGLRRSAIYALLKMDPTERLNEALLVDGLRETHSARRRRFIPLLRTQDVRGLVR
ncbi:MAG: HEAT repeat protein [Candidatus Binatia bacterium]|jgi:HEAT repeat protein